MHVYVSKRKTILPNLEKSTCQTIVLHLITRINMVKGFVDLPGYIMEYRFDCFPIIWQSNETANKKRHQEKDQKASAKKEKDQKGGNKKMKIIDLGHSLPCSWISDSVKNREFASHSCLTWLVFVSSIVFWII